MSTTFQSVLKCVDSGILKVCISDKMKIIKIKMKKFNFSTVILGGNRMLNWIGIAIAHWIMQISKTTNIQNILGRLEEGFAVFW